MIEKYYSILLFLLFYTLPGIASTEKVNYIFDNKAQLLKIDHGVAVFVDETNKLTIEDVVKQRFEMNTNEIPNFGITPNRVWVKFRILNQTDEKNLFLLVAQPSLDQITLYTTNHLGEWKELDLGEYKKYRERFIDNPNYIFPVAISAHHEQEFYISIKSSDQMQIPLFLGTERKIAQRESIRTLFFGMYIGVIMIMAFYHLFIYASIRKLSYLYYILYIVFVGLVQMNFQGYAFKFLWPNSTWLALNSTYLLPMFSGFATALFTKKFLNTKFFTPTLHKGINIYIFLCVSAALGGLLGFGFFGVQVLQIIALVGAVYAMLIAYVIIQRGYRPAKFFLLAFALFFSCVIIFVLQNFNIIPYTVFTASILEVGSVIQITLLSFALADEINRYRKEKEVSQAQALDVLKENERIVKEQNVFLEKEVSIRTADLSKSNEDLQTVIHDLKLAQTQLVVSEKLASLGMLTAGIAHEINNPINFVTSNISPLRRDIDQVFDALTQFESVGLSLTTIQEKKEEIEKIKTDLELDYLKEEVQFLLTGIEDGAKRTAGIVKSLRIFSRVDESDLKYADINLGMESTLVILNSQFKDMISVEIDYGELPLIECYPGKLNQVFLNLLTNASHALKKKYGDQLGGKLQIKTYLNGGWVHIHVNDNGPGIPDDVKSKIFDPFYTTKDVGEGTGLGLSIAYQAILKHKGEILVNSIPDEGVEFIVRIPVRQSDAADDINGVENPF